MRRVALNTIALLFGDTLFEEGAVITIDADTDPDLVAVVEARIAAETAEELRGDGGPSAEFVSAAASWSLAASEARHGFVRLLDLVDAGGEAEAVAFADLLATQEGLAGSDLRSRIDVVVGNLERRLPPLFEGAAQADDQQNSAAGSVSAPAAEAAGAGDTSAAISTDGGPPTEPTADQLVVLETVTAFAKAAIAPAAAPAETPPATPPAPPSATPPKPAAARKPRSGSPQKKA